MKGWKTVLFNIAFAVLPILEIAGADFGLSGLGLQLYSLGVVIANLILRTLTTTPVGKSE